MKLNGGCLCGAVRFEGNAEPVFQVKCHCVDCRKLAGSGHAAMIGVASDSVTFAGEVREFSSRADSGREVTRGFCAACGAGIRSRNAAAPGLVFLRASALDDPNQFAPQMSVWTSRATTWDAVTTGIPAFPENPELSS